MRLTIKTPGRILVLTLYTYIKARNEPYVCSSLRADATMGAKVPAHYICKNRPPRQKVKAVFALLLPSIVARTNNVHKQPAAIHTITARCPIISHLSHPLRAHHPRHAVIGLLRPSAATVMGLPRASPPSWDCRPPPPVAACITGSWVSPGGAASSVYPPLPGIAPRRAPALSPARAPASSP